MKRMGVTKTEGFTDRQNQLAAFAKAIGHPARVAIIDYLLTQKTCICGDIVAALPLSQPTISQHLTALKRAGLIRGTVAGNTVCYCLDPAGFEQLAHYITNALRQLGPLDTNCC